MKTTIATRFPNSLLLAAEKGYSALPGIFVQPINRWSDFLMVLRELKETEVQEKFETIVLDTADILYDYCEQYVCGIEGVNTIGEVPYGQGYSKVAKEFDTRLRQIVQMNYGIVMISHEIDRTFTDEAGLEYNKIIPTLPNKAKLIVSRMTDIIGYIRGVDTAEGHQVYMFLRGTPRFEAGSRFKYIEEKIILSYDNLVGALGRAIDKEALESDNKYVSDERENVHMAAVEIDFDTVMLKFKKISDKLLLINTPYYGPRIVHVINKQLGIGKKVSDCTIDQAMIVEIIASELEAFPVSDEDLAKYEVTLAELKAEAEAMEGIET